MKEELTREVLEAMTKCGESSCSKCTARDFCKGRLSNEIWKIVATALLEEMDKPKVWDGAPEWANSAQVRWFKPDYPVGIDENFSKLYTRELPKTSARKNAEELYEMLYFQRTGKTDCINAIESALEKYAAELGTAT